MKKITKIFISLILTLVMVAPALVNAATGNGSITIKNDPATTGVSMKGHKYSAYKIFDVITGSSGNYNYTVDSDFKDFFKGKATPSDDVSTDTKLNKYAYDYVNNADINALATEIKNYIIAKSISYEAESGAVNVALDKTEDVIIKNLPLGYYIVLDKGDGSEIPSFIAAASLGTTDPNLVINLKASAPTIDKQIKHNDSGKWGIVGDNQVGDKVEYKLISKVPSNLTGYTTYTYNIHDSLSAGLTFNNDIEIYVGDKDTGTKLDSSYYTVNNNTNANKFDISVDILTAISANKFKAGDILNIYYSATLNENAVVASNHNDNTAYLEYSNNPYEDSKEETIKVTVKDYTFKLNGLKTKEDKITALPGAKFEISREGKAIYFKKDVVANKYTVCAEKHEHGTGCTTEIVSGENGRFEIVGLDDAVEYTLKETEAPAGYNAIDPIKFTITATYDVDGNIIDITTSANGITKENSTFELATTIVNTTGSKLPETGGIGRTIFTVIGGLLMISAAGLLIVKFNKKTV
ncbi:SpaH/EbpB family LPXTG-anchored major pilin [Clostridium paraputrificum]|uniref:SpaH/EbpB family LPXTG-anchored major pilin n=1 Tax=Clostridium paraputrificum TaxID=29363 RepID=UPI003D35024C